MSDDFLGDLHDAMPERPDDHAQAALAEASGWVGTHGVEAVGLGEGEGGEQQVVVYTSGSPDEIPETVGGLPIRVERTGPVQAYDDAEDADRPDDSDSAPTEPEA